MKSGFGVKTGRVNRFLGGKSDRFQVRLRGVRRKPLTNDPTSANLMFANNDLTKMTRQMARIYIFGDESGNLDFSGNTGATKYFLVTTVAMESCNIGNDLLELKRELHWNDYRVNDFFHAVDDRQAVRDKVFSALGQHSFRIDSTILEKAKAMPHLIKDDARFYKQAWYLHLKYVVPKVTSPDDEVFLVAASFGTNARKTAARSALEEVIAQAAVGRKSQLACWPASTDPCLQVADYCCWAIQRKWERSDTRSHSLISSKIRTEFDAFASGRVFY